MKLNPGMEAEYKRRHDEIWPELVALLKEAGVSDYSIHLDRETNTLFGVLWRTRRPRHGRSAEASGDAALVGAHGRHHGDQAGQRAGGGAARHRLPHGMTMAAIRQSPSSTSARPTPRWRWSICATRRADRGSHASPTRLRRRPYPHYDVERLWSFILDSLARASTAKQTIDDDLGHHPWRRLRPARRRRAGAAGARLRIRRPGEPSARLRASRAAIRRDALARLPNGLNVGRQFFWQSRRFPEEFARVDAILPYPQYWAWRLTGARRRK